MSLRDRLRRTRERVGGRIRRNLFTQRQAARGIREAAEDLRRTWRAPGDRDPALEGLWRRDFRAFLYAQGVSEGDLPELVRGLRREGTAWIVMALALAVYGALEGGVLYAGAMGLGAASLGVVALTRFWRARVYEARRYMTVGEYLRGG